MSKLSRIPTPPRVRWQRLKYRALPALAVVVAAALAVHVWRGGAPSPAMTGQVNTETAEARSPGAGVLTTQPAAGGHVVQVYDAVSAGQVIARVERKDGATVDVVAPIAGKVVSVHARPGDAVKTNEPLYTVAADRGRYVTAYVRTGSKVKVAPGSPMVVRPRSDPSAAVKAVVERVGPQYEPIPAVQLRDRKAEEWGLPVLIALPAGTDAAAAVLRPGEVVSVTVGKSGS